MKAVKAKTSLIPFVLHLPLPPMSSRLVTQTALQLSLLTVLYENHPDKDILNFDLVDTTFTPQSSFLAFSENLAKLVSLPL